MVFSTIFKNYEDIIKLEKASKGFLQFNPCVYTLFIVHLAATVAVFALYLSNYIEIATAYICIDVIIIMVCTSNLLSSGEVDIGYLNHLCSLAQMLYSYNISLADADKVNNLINEASKHTFHINPESVKATLLSIFSGLGTAIGLILSIVPLIYEKGYEHWPEIESTIVDVIQFWLITCALIFATYYITKKINYPKTNKYDRFIDDIKQAHLICNDQGVIEVDKIYRLQEVYK